MSENRRLVVLFITLDGYGHLNSCIGIAEKLVLRGHRAIFALERAWKGRAKRYPGLEEAIFIDPKRDPNLEANQYWILFMEKFKKKFGLPPLEALKEMDLDLEEDFFNTLLNVDGEIKNIIDDIKPDVIVVDSYTTVPAVYKSGIPWVWLTSANPLYCLPSDDLPPAGTDYATFGDRRLWKNYRELFAEKVKDLVERYNKRLVDEFGLEPVKGGIMCHPSPYLNIYAYPKELDYLNIRPLPSTKWQNFDHFIRFTERDESFKIPDKFFQKPLGKLIYVSMGSMGCADIDLMNRLINMLSKSPNRFIFSLGPYAEKLIELPDNIWGMKFLPQVQVLKRIHLVITHGGNNTVIESLYFARPMIVMPLFGDQFNNAQRISELGLGCKMNPYRCEEEELLKKIQHLLTDRLVKVRLERVSKRMQYSSSTEKAATAIEEVAMKKPESEIVEQKKVEPEKVEQKKAEQDKVEQKKVKPEKVEQEKVELKKSEPKKAEIEKSEREKSEPEKSELEKIELEKSEPEKLSLEKLKLEKSEAEKEEPENSEAEKSEPEKSKRKKSESKKSERKKSKREESEQEDPKETK